ncbi:hypothetical protein [Verminephrobacter aporrectodeae]|uniref:DUF4145 domain-containing protein n=1 Tax=Verminephrobacter aporrectodeae subsp. tuberculatae TaxID=1110392 RepID=A0ABT3KYL4_9BURK|nr:hypothetical protein [Verminephrobacter aporrectodeae]MCW5256222.1 hypothetical protein [Verminephrobacter aporrectodeae subsp. tuberculatae]MCW5323418.1 hypothetical protein [Verminephrobacter aporrectodeae subsp. tuberculatae]MCW8175128.1 hypothetical protein [Verminephrobacter aporrectodeae subsp. tuberculatae]MCW8202504.1 hypothetical protein [Verminephrobacter aporrectodeae subsp. tuberculatae]
MTPTAWDALAKIIPPVLIVAGWYVVVSNQARQSRRKVIREELETLLTLVTELGEMAIKFHTHSYDEDLRRNILIRFARITRRADLLPRIARTSWITWDAVAAKRLPDPIDRIIALRQAVTLHHFDDPKQPALGTDSREMDLIVNACHDLLMSLDEILITALD